MKIYYRVIIAKKFRTTLKRFFYLRLITSCLHFSQVQSKWITFRSFYDFFGIAVPHSSEIELLISEKKTNYWETFPISILNDEIKKLITNNKRYPFESKTRSIFHEGQRHKFLNSDS